MLNILLELKEPLEYITRNTNNNEYKQLRFNSLEWFILSQIKKTFKVFNKPSIKLQGETYITLPESLLNIYKIYNKLNNLQKEYQRKINQTPDFVSKALLLLLLLL